MLARRLYALIAAAFAASLAIAEDGVNGLYWYNGQHKTVITPRALTADFASQTATKQPLLLSPAQAARDIRARDGGVYSEVFYTDGQLHALPGGVLVRFADNWADTDIAAFIAKHDLIAQGQVSIYWQFAAPPGVPSLSLANRLFETGEVAEARPVWWRQYALR